MTKLKRKDYSKEEYITKIIHDFKTPINAQIKALELFLATTQNKLIQEEKDLIELTINSCDYMQKLIEIFTSVHQLKNKNLMLNYEKFNITELVENSIKELGVLLKFYELKVIFNYKKELIVNADKLQIKRVIENLLSNSINYAFKNTKIKIDLFKNKNLFFTVENKSPYIEPSALKEIFKKYKTQATQYNKNGVGLGLYLSEEIINAHQGQMIAKSSLDETNIFGFWIPID